MWSSGCGDDYGTKFPSLNMWGSGDITISIGVDPGQAPPGTVCGNFQAVLNSSGKIVGGWITLFGTSSNGQSCASTRPETLSHELGHVFGLDESECFGYMMSTNYQIAGIRSVQSDECAEVQDNWQTGNECWDANANGSCDVNEFDDCVDLNFNGRCDDAEGYVPDPDQDTCPTGPPCWSPLIINLTREPWQLSGPDDPVAFDIDGDGFRNRMTWTSGNSSLAFLAVDRNGNGRIDSGAELFGNWTPLAPGRRAVNGFQALEAYDTNSDRQVGAEDTNWSDLLLWIDRNHDGISQAGELQYVAESEIRAFELVYHWTGRHDKRGNYFAYQALARVGNERRSLYDIYFTVVP
ncbi:MAG TPA: hypothetical protein VF883_05535 [Thermoanaerobaculia bacterium]|jgi:hypothetical protein